jgi:methionine-rich copper-binding protein CopC
MSSKFLTGLSLLGLLFVSQAGMERAWAHAYPAVSSPLDGAVLKEPPREVRIQFTERLELAFSQIVVKGPNSEVFSQGKLRKLADDTVAVDLKPLRSGKYTVEWQVLSVDTHVTEDVLRFTVGLGEK